MKNFLWLQPEANKEEDRCYFYYRKMQENLKNREMQTRQIKRISSLLSCPLLVKTKETKNTLTVQNLVKPNCCNTKKKACHKTSS